ncbi:PAP/fibrillin family protein [Microseira wollei]|uniref:Fibrillin n=1 Tax=Microseira wollei NIES-4236 TaxID=2530354 RepID=A0AAV3XGE2_9CYAN|nr:PAP/fibrillin family protein [Microseira wollei]GET39990.1 fibrillin [Microseira wollei NIES-4236]
MEKQNTIGDETTRLALKTELLQRVEALGTNHALFPSPAPPIDQIVQQLESLNPIPRPLSPNHLPSLLGDWQLVYASRGTVVTRTIASMPNIWGGIQLERVWQKLVAGNTGKISAANGAFLNLPLLGEWQLQAYGTWDWGQDEQVAKVTFGTFSIRATKPFGSSSWNLPSLKIPVLEFLRKEALWTTSYLDAEIRIGRGATGNLFVFRRDRQLVN